MKSSTTIKITDKNLIEKLKEIRVFQYAIEDIGNGRVECFSRTFILGDYYTLKCSIDISWKINLSDKFEIVGSEVYEIEMTFGQSCYPVVLTDRQKEIISSRIVNSIELV